jgi:hypothetical protein
VADIFRRHGEAFRRSHDRHLGRVERRVMAAKLGCTAETLRLNACVQGVQQAERDQGLRAGPTREDHGRIKVLAETINGLFNAEVIHRHGP